MVKKNKTTIKHFELFRSECLRWAEILGLKGWEIRFDHMENGEEYENDLSLCTTDCLNRCCKLSLFKQWPDEFELNDEEVRLSAFHEVCHVFLDLIGSVARTRFIMKHELDEAEHAMIRTLENVLYPQYKVR